MRQPVWRGTAAAAHVGGADFGSLSRRAVLMARANRVPVKLPRVGLVSTRVAWPAPSPSTAGEAFCLWPREAQACSAARASWPPVRPWRRGAGPRPGQQRRGGGSAAEGPASRAGIGRLDNSPGASKRRQGRREGAGARPGSRDGRRFRPRGARGAAACN